VAELLTNSTDPRFVRLCGEQSDTFISNYISKRFEVLSCSERALKVPEALDKGNYKFQHVSTDRVEKDLQSGIFTVGKNTPCLLDK